MTCAPQHAHVFARERFERSRRARLHFQFIFVFAPCPHLNRQALVRPAGRAKHGGELKERA
jgi:hypothetical protein